MARKTAGTHFERGSGNVFADLGFPDPELERFKATLMLQIYRIITQRKLTQAQAGKVLGIRQPNVSRLMRGSSGSYSVERLMEFLTALGHNVEVKITPTRRKHGVMSVVVAA
jgi:predicted XRE-type DNA-binding protein